jgi:hypothetical protein
VEVLVALVMSALLLVVVMDGAIGARQREKRASDKVIAVALARELLARTTVAPFTEGSRSGANEGSELSWEVRESAEKADPRRRFVLAEIVVEIHGRNGEKLLRVSTRRLKPLVHS